MYRLKNVRLILGQGRPWPETRREWDRAGRDLRAPGQGDPGQPTGVSAGGRIEPEFDAAAGIVVG